VVWKVEKIVYVLDGLKFVIDSSHEDAHQNVGHCSTDLIFEKQRIFAMADCPLEKTLCRIQLVWREVTVVEYVFPAQIFPISRLK
jgi:hypothetical protein